MALALEALVMDGSMALAVESARPESSEVNDDSSVESDLLVPVLVQPFGCVLQTAGKADVEDPERVRKKSLAGIDGDQSRSALAGWSAGSG